MYKGDRSRKETLVEYGFRMPRRARQPPAEIRRVEQLAPQDDFCLGHAGASTKRATDSADSGAVLRPTTSWTGGEVRPVARQIEDVMSEIKLRTSRMSAC